MILGDIVRRYRAEHNISMGEFAKLSGMSKAYVHMLEANRNTNGKPIIPSLQTINKVSSATGIPLEEILKMISNEGGMFEVQETPNRIDVYVINKEKDKPSYYNDPEVAAIAQEMHDNRDLKVLFDASRNLSKESIEEVRKFIEWQKAKEGLS